MSKRIEDELADIKEQLSTNAELLSIITKILPFLVPVGTQQNIDNLITQANNLGMAGRTPTKEEPKMPYLSEGTFFQRKDKRWEAKITINGKQKTVACCTRQEDAYNKLKQAIRSKRNIKPTEKEKDYTLFTWLDHWHEVFRKPKLATGELSKNTIISDVAFIKRIKIEFKKDIKLKDLTADMIQQILNNMTLTRTCEGVYTVLKLALDKAKSRTGGVSVMEQVEKVKHERKRGRALTKDEIERLLAAARNETERDVINFYIYTGCRVDEISATKVNYINLTSEPRIIANLTNTQGKPVPDITLLPNEILIHGTKTKGSIRTLPIMPPLKPILERLCTNRDGAERLFPYTTVVIRNFHKLIKAATNIKFTLKDYRHTFATNCKDNGIPTEVYAPWFGWSDDTMARKVYTHKTDYEKKQSQEWARKFV